MLLMQHHDADIRVKHTNQIRLEGGVSDSPTMSHVHKYVRFLIKKGQEKWENTPTLPRSSSLLLLIIRPLLNTNLFPVYRPTGL